MEDNKESNQIFATDYVESKEMAETTKDKLAEFLNLENLVDWNNLSQDNKSKFYDFIREAYAQGNIHVSWEEFSEIVKDKSDLAEELVKEYYGKYQKGMELLLLSI